MGIDLAKTESFELGPLSIQPRLLTVSSTDESATLEPRVMQVLVLLASNAGDVVDRDLMIEQCWDGVIVGDDAIQRCIGRLRRLASQLSGFEIQTIPKIGYRLLREGGDTHGQSVKVRCDSLSSNPSIGIAPAIYHGPAQKGEALAQLLGSDIAAALSLNREHAVLVPGSTEDPLFLASLELRDDTEKLRAHCKLTETQSGRIVWSDAISLPSERMLDNGIPSEEVVVDLASRFSTIVIREVTETSLAQDEAQSAWQAVVRANAAYQRIDLPNLARAIEEARAAIVMDPRYPAAHAALANALAAHYELGGALNEAEAEEARKHCDMALALAPEDANVLAWVAHALLMITRPAEGMALARKAVDLAPWHPIAHLYLARHHLHHGQPEEAEQSLEEHARVAPLFPWKYFPLVNLGVARFMLGDLEAAEKHLTEASELNPTYPYSWISLMVLGALKSDVGLMRSAGSRLRQIEGNDNLDLQLARLAHSYPDPTQAEMVQTAFKKAWTE